MSGPRRTAGLLRPRLARHIPYAVLRLRRYGCVEPLWQPAVRLEAFVAGFFLLLGQGLRIDVLLCLLQGEDQRRQIAGSV